MKPNAEQNLLNFTRVFICGIRDHYKLILKLDEVNPDSKVMDKTLESMISEYKPETIPDDILINEAHATIFLEDDWCKMQSLLALAITEKFELTSLNFVSYLHVRDLLESIFNEGVEESSSYSRMIGYLEIPLEMVPQKYVSTLYRADEFVSASFMIHELMGKMDEPDFDNDIAVYRGYIEQEGNELISKLHDRGFFGTYNIGYFVELLICYKLSFPYIGPLYITSDFPKISICYPHLRKRVEELWEKTKHIRGDSLE